MARRHARHSPPAGDTFLPNLPASGPSTHRPKLQSRAARGSRASTRARAQARDQPLRGVWRCLDRGAWFRATQHGNGHRQAWGYAWFPSPVPTPLSSRPVPDRTRRAPIERARDKSSRQRQYPERSDGRARGRAPDDRARAPSQDVHRRSRHHHLQPSRLLRGCDGRRRLRPSSGRDSASFSNASAASVMVAFSLRT